MSVIDLDSLEAEGAREPHVVKLGGQEFQIRPSLPFAFMRAASRSFTPSGETSAGDKLDEFVALVAALLVDPTRVDALLDAGLDFDKFTQILKQAYGFKLGESSASTGSSPRTGTRSRPTSNGSTGSTSGRAAGARTPAVSAGSSS